MAMCSSLLTDATSQMLYDEPAFGVICEVVVPEDGTVVELRQTVDADLMCLCVKQHIPLTSLLKFTNVIR